MSQTFPKTSCPTLKSDLHQSLVYWLHSVDKPAGAMQRSRFAFVSYDDEANCPDLIISKDNNAEYAWCQTFSSFDGVSLVRVQATRECRSARSLLTQVDYASKRHLQGRVCGISLRYVYVHPALRRQGINTGIIHTIVSFVRHSLHLNFVLAHNVVSKAALAVLTKSRVKFLVDKSSKQKLMLYWIREPQTHKRKDRANRVCMSANILLQPADDN